MITLKEMLERQSVLQQTAPLRTEISSLKLQLSQGDYVIIKCMEYSLVGLEPPYDITAIHEERQLLRDRINELEAQLED